VICMKVFKDAGLQIPGDIAIAGFNNEVVSRISDPMITTINYPGEEMGRTAARQLISLAEGKSPQELTNTIILKSKLIVRASTLKNKPKT